MKKNRIRMFAWLLACTVTVTSVPATGTLIYASEDLFSDGGETEVEYVEEVPVFDDGTGEEESTEEVFTEEAEPVTTSLTEEEGIALLSENETVDTGLKVEENKTPEISVYQGEEVELVVKASINEGFGKISYEWYEGAYGDEELIEGATEAVLKFTCISSYTDTYHCVISDDYGNKRHWQCSVTGISGVTVEEKSLEKVAAIGDDIEFEVKASVADEVGPLTYQWYERIYDEDLEGYKNIKIEGETSSSLKLSNVQEGKNYVCAVGNKYGYAGKYVFCYLRVESGLKVEETTVKKTVFCGDSVELEAKASINEGFGEITYQWYRFLDEEREYYKIEGKTSSTLQLSNVKYSTRYKCVVSDQYGNSKDVIFDISIDTGIQVEEREIKKSVTQGEDVTFEVKASAVEGVTLTYQWYKYDEDWLEFEYLLKGETTKTLKLSNVQESAVYCCCVGNGTITAEIVYCYVDVEKENIDTGLKLEESIYEKYIAAGSDVAFEVKASVKEGCGEISYQWYDSDFNELEGQNTAVLQLTNVQKSANYYCEVSDISGKKKRVDCFVYVNESGLVMDATTVSKTVPLGATVKLEVKASVNDGYSIDYEWWKYEGGDTVTLDGENASTLILSNVQEAGAYCCQVHVSGSMKSIPVYFDVDVEEEQHTHTWSDWQVTQAATYTTTGLQTRSCTGCDAEETAEIARVTIPTPTLVSAAETSGKSITVTWNAVNGIDGYEVYRKTAGADWAQLAEVSSDTTSYVDSNATAGIEYIYTVKAYCNNGSEKIYGGYDEAGKSATVVAVHEHSWGAWEVTKAATYTTTGLQTRSCTGCDAKETAEIARVTIPTPTLVSASATAEKTITFTWNAVSGIDGYYVYRKVAGGKWKRLANLSSDKVSYVDSGVTAGTAYIYTVKAYCNNGSEKIYGSYDAAGKTVTAVAKAATPTLVSAKATAGNTITFKWKAVSGVDGYRVYRKKAGGSYKALANVSAGVTSYADKTAKAGVSYTYTVRAYNNLSGKVLLSSYVAAGKTATAKAGIPTLVSAKATAGNTIKFKWKAVSGIDGYRVYRKTANGSYKALKDVSASTTSYVDKTAKAGVSYTYTVRAYNTVNGSKLLSYYTAAGKTATAKAKAPTISSVKALGSRKVEVSWESVSGVNGYRVYRKTAGGSWKAIKTVSSKTTSYTDKTAKAGVKYYYTVRAYNTVNGSKLLGFYNKTGKAVTAK